MIVLVIQFLDLNVESHYSHLGPVGYTLLWDALLAPWIGMPSPHLRPFSGHTHTSNENWSHMADYVLVEGHVNKHVQGWFHMMMLWSTQFYSYFWNISGFSDMKNLIGEASCRICQESFSTTVTGNLSKHCFAMYIVIFFE